MRGYKIKENDNQWYFELYPNNNHSQLIGRSKYYQSYAECEKAVHEFGNFVKQNNLSSPTPNKLEIDKIMGGFIFRYIKDGQEIFRRHSPYGNSRNPRNTVLGICKYIDEYTTNHFYD